jgi:carboxyl-terminal processing protease
MKIKRFGHYIVLILIIGISFAAGIGTKAWIDKSQVKFPILNQAFRYLSDYAYQPPEDDEKLTALEYGMINGMFQAFGDPHTRFVAPAVHEIEMNQLDGVFGGIGAQIEKNADGLFIMYPSKDSPAQLAGMQDGDELLQVDNVDISAEYAMDDVLAAIRGPVNTKVSLLVRHISDQSEENLTIKREEFNIPSVTYHFPNPENKIGVIKATIVAASTPDEIKAALDDLVSQGAESIVLDLRDNSGGYVDAGVNIAGMFLPKGDIIGRKYSDESKNQLITQSKNGEYQDIPLYVFVNHGTASAAEIIAGALQAQDRVKIIGTTSYGKNSIQLVFDLSDGSSVHITNAIWYVPGLPYDIGENGIQPDILLAEDQMTLDICLQKVMEDLQTQ